ncbi:hypothetical protein LCGC14_0286870 [marine sediment metagenome]|uniref:Uncharacterized protein n=1 Tax=marine sediment metagenome TaxID=412755 RepID=A0A0F9TUJ4_9ZZZZ
MIIFYANDTVSNENFTQVLVRKDIYKPKIAIVSPNQNNLFNDTAPLFNVEITDPNLHKMWYTIDDGFINKTFDTNETINQGLWSLGSKISVNLKNKLEKFRLKTKMRIL